MTPGLTQQSQEMRHVMIREVLRGSLTTPGWQPKETVLQLPQQDAQKPWRGHPSCDGTADYLPSGTRSVVTRHGAMADGTKRTSRDLGAAPPDQTLARPASEVVRDLLQRRRGAPRTPSFSAREKGEGTQVPRCSRTQWRRGVSSLLRSCCGNYSPRAGSSCPRFFPQQSFRLGLATLAQRLIDYSLFSPSGCGCHCATPFLRRVQCRSGSQTLQKRQRLFPYCSLFSTFCVYFHATHFIACWRQ